MSTLLHLRRELHRRKPAQWPEFTPKQQEELENDDLFREPLSIKASLTLILISLLIGVVIHLVGA